MAVQLDINANVRGQRAIDNLNNSTRRLGNESQVATRAFRALNTVLAGLSIGVVATQIGRAADAMTNLNAQLMATGSSAQLAVQQISQVARIAQDTGTSFNAVSLVFARIQRSTRELNVTTQQVATAAQAVQQSFRLSGATTQEAAAASVQLGQALGAARLNGDELRSILENNVVLAQAIADEFGVTRGELRELGEQGRLVSDRVFAAILNNAEEINRQFGLFGNIFQQSATRAANSFNLVAGELGVVLDEALLINDTIAGWTDGITAAFESGRTRGIIIDFVNFVDINFARLRDVVDNVFNFVGIDLNGPVNAALTGLVIFEATRQALRILARTIGFLLFGPGILGTALSTGIGGIPATAVTQGPARSRLRTLGRTMAGVIGTAIAAGGGVVLGQQFGDAIEVEEGGFADVGLQVGGAIAGALVAQSVIDIVGYGLNLLFGTAARATFRNFVFSALTASVIRGGVTSALLTVIAGLGTIAIPLITLGVIAWDFVFNDGDLEEALRRRLANFSYDITSIFGGPGSAEEGRNRNLSTITGLADGGATLFTNSELTTIATALPEVIEQLTSGQRESLLSKLSDELERQNNDWIPNWIQQVQLLTRALNSLGGSEASTQSFNRGGRAGGNQFGATGAGSNQFDILLALFDFIQAGGLNFNTGGLLSGPGTGTSDSILARLSNGEFVVNARATEAYLPLLQAINSGIPAFQNGTDEPIGGNRAGIQTSISNRRTDLERLTQELLIATQNGNQFTIDAINRSITRNTAELERLEGLLADIDDNTDPNNPQNAGGGLFAGTGDALNTSLQQGLTTQLNSLLTGGGFNVDTLLDTITSAIIGSFVDNLVSSLFVAHEGGIVPGPRGAERLILAQSGERVLPLNESGGDGAGRNVTVNLQVVGDVSRQTRSEVARMIPEIASGVNSQNRRTGALERGRA